jgi:hypothetical protein
MAAWATVVGANRVICTDSIAIKVSRQIEYADICVWKDRSMRTRLDIDDVLLIQAKSFAARAHTSLTRVIEECLSSRLRATQTTTHPKKRPIVAVYAGRGGLRPLIRDRFSQRALLDAADEADIAQ